MPTKLKDQEELDTDILRPNSQCKPSSEWACMKEGYMAEVKDRAKDNPLLIDYN